MATLRFKALAVTMLTNGFTMSCHTSLFFYIFVHDHDCTSAQLSLILTVPAAFQILNHLVLLPMAIRRVGPGRFAILTSYANLLFTILLAIFGQNLWGLIVLFALSYWGSSFSQGNANMLTSKLAAEMDPSVAGAINGFARAFLNLGQNTRTR
eukprot:FR741416.1.p1 GENE.FR741416.1~~FR741416.1.p1  ORF type:complete len:153 (+),score=5.97 FR741416.1:46-504(+)